MIGEQFDNGDEIYGTVVSVRDKQGKLSIWIKNATNQTAQVSTIILKHSVCVLRD
ncbi:hypothetical protein MKX03_014261 [Papaver bracteatum]|nr:hypothetical protein MKX03_014261 [Papaver bracteatum]